MQCRECHKEFKPIRKQQKSCSAKCRDAYHNRSKRVAIEHYKTCPLVLKAAKTP